MKTLMHLGEEREKLPISLFLTSFPLLASIVLALLLVLILAARVE